MIPYGAFGRAAVDAANFGRKYPSSGGGGGGGWRGQGLVSFVAFVFMIGRALSLAAAVGVHGWAMFGVFLVAVVVLWQLVFEAWGPFGYVAGTLVAGLAAGALLSVGRIHGDDAPATPMAEGLPWAVAAFVVVGLDQWFVKKARTLARS